MSTRRRIRAGGGALLLAGLVALLSGGTVWSGPDDGRRRAQCLSQAGVGAALAPGQLHRREAEILGQVGGEAFALAVRANHLYVGAGAVLTVLDISDPSRPRLVGASAPLPDVITDIAVAGSRAYVANRRGSVSVFDLTDPAQPRDVAVLPIGPDVWRVAVANGLAYLMSDGSVLRVLDVREPDTPVEIGSLRLGTAGRVIPSGDRVYVTSPGHLAIVDVSDPAHPRQVGSASFPVSRDCHWDQGTLAAAAGSYVYVSTQEDSLYVVDAADPSQPRIVGSIATGFFGSRASVLEVAVAGRYVYSASQRGLRVFDVADPTRPVDRGVYDGAGGVYAVVARGDALHVTGEAGASILRMDAAAGLSKVGTYARRGAGTLLTTSGRFAYVAATPGGIDVVDVADPRRPQADGTHTAAWVPSRATIGGGVMVVAVDGQGLRVLSLADPVRPIEMGALSLPGFAHALATAGQGRVVLATSSWPHGWGSGHLRVLDVADPARPVELGSLLLPGAPRDLVVVGRHAFVAEAAESGSGLRVVDLADPGRPALGRLHATRGYAGPMASVGSRLYVLASRTSGVYPETDLAVFDISDPAEPRFERQYDVSWLAHPLALALADGRAYIVDNPVGLCGLDLDTVSPTPVLDCDERWGPGGRVAVNGPDLYVAHRWHGFVALRLPSRSLVGRRLLLPLSARGAGGMQSAGPLR
jgi:hypothetical protein